MCVTAGVTILDAVCVAVVRAANKLVATRLIDLSLSMLNKVVPFWIATYSVKVTSC